jgi:dienelactone hydrolase
MRGRGRAGLDVLRSLAEVDPHKLAGIGYCVGGTLVLELARDGADSPRRGSGLAPEDGDHPIVPRVHHFAALAASRKALVKT